MNKLTSLSIHNVKGIDSKAFSLDLHPNKPSIFVAPNGYGKSSIACAFKSLNNSRIKLDEKDFHLRDTSLSPKIILALGTETYEATASSNAISKKFDVFVINSPVYAKSINRNMGGFSTSSASLEVEPVTLIDTVPGKQDFDYSVSEFKKSFGNNGKILPNPDDLICNLEFLYSLEKQIDRNAFSKERIYRNPIRKIIDQINIQTGTAEAVKQYVSTYLISSFRAIDPLRNLADLVSKFCNTSELDHYLLSYQIINLFETPSFSKALYYQLYLKERNFFDELLGSVDSTRHKIKTQEVSQKSKKSLVVKFPKADEISNGQRDILSFIAQIQKAKRRLSKQHCILVIDEIFDYLDDANLVSFQYYVTTIIEEFKEQKRFIYPLLLTHLDPGCFYHFCFNKHKLQIRYLAKNDSSAKSLVLNLVKHRDDHSIKNEVSQHHFHYHPEEKDLESKFELLGIKRSWGKSHKFYEEIETERVKCISGQDYDPVAVLLAVRIRIEKNAYDNLEESKRKGFLGQNTTRNKLDYCEEEGFEIPEVHYLLGIVYNDALHWKDNKDYETPIRSKLDNPTIKKMISTL